MHKMLVSKPFDAFWISCQANNIMSVLTSADPSYIMAGAQNDFSYEIIGRSGWFKTPTVLYGEELEHALYRIRRKEYVFEMQDPVAELLTRIRENRIISVEIDLFNWNPDSLDYGRNHVKHMSMCIGADEEKQEFYFDDAVIDQGILTKSFSEIAEAFSHPDEPLKAAEFRVPEQIPPYQYDIGQIRSQAAKLVNNLERLRYQSYFSTYEQPQDLNVIVNYITKIYNRQIANQVLIKQLYQDGHLNQECFQMLTETAVHLTKQWNLIKNKLMKIMISNRKHDFTKLEHRADQAFAAEQGFWKLLAEQKQERPRCTPQQAKFVPLHPAGALQFSVPESVQTCSSGIRLTKMELILDQETDYYTHIRLHFSNVSGSLRARCEQMPFVITSVSEAFTDANYVKSVRFEGDSILLKTECPLADIAGLWHFTLRTVPEAVYSDACGQKGPQLNVPSLGITSCGTPFINTLECSKPLLCSDIAAAAYPEGLTFSPVSFRDYECDLAALCKDSPPEQDTVCCRFRLTAQSAEPVRLWFGHQAAAKLWVNGTEAGTVTEKKTPPHRDLLCMEFMLCEGENEVMMLCKTNAGTARGILAKLCLTGAEYNGIRAECNTIRFPEFMSHCG